MEGLLFVFSFLVSELLNIFLHNAHTTFVPTIVAVSWLITVLMLV